MALDAGRRRFLQLAGTGTALSIAGCNALQSRSGGDGESSNVGLVVTPGREAQQQLRRRQLQVQSQVRSGEMDRREAQAEIRTAREEAYSEPVEAFTGRAEAGPLTVEDSVESQGLFLVSGPADALVEALGHDEVAALIPESDFEQATTQQGGGGASPPPTESGSDDGGSRGTATQSGNDSG